MRLYLCEKPSQDKDIARVLSIRQQGNGCCNGSGIVVIWCIDHLLETVPPERYGERHKRWSIEALPILPEAWHVEVKAKTVTQFSIVQQLVPVPTPATLPENMSEVLTVLASLVKTAPRLRFPWSTGSTPCCVPAPGTTARSAPVKLLGMNDKEQAVYLIFRDVPVFIDRLIPGCAQ
jgi:hypothetical protein